MFALLCIILFVQFTFGGSQFPANTCSNLNSQLLGVGANQTFINALSVDPMGEWLYNGVFTGIGAGQSLATGCDSSCRYCSATANKFDTIANQYAYLLNATSYSTYQYPLTPANCLRTTRASTIGCSTVCGGNGLQTNCTFDNIVSSGNGISLNDTVAVAGSLTINGAKFKKPRQPFAWIYAPGSTSYPSYSANAANAITILSFQSGDSVLGNAWTQSTGTFTAPYNGVFYMHAAIRMTAGNQYYEAWWVPSSFNAGGTTNGLGWQTTTGSGVGAVATVQLLQGQTMVIIGFSPSSWQAYGGSVYIQTIDYTT